MKSRHERAALFGFFRNCSETLISSDVNREGYAYRAIESAKVGVEQAELAVSNTEALLIVQTGYFCTGYFYRSRNMERLYPDVVLYKVCRYSDTVVLYALDYQGKCFCSISWGDHECRRIECPDNHVKFCGKLQNH